MRELPGWKYCEVHGRYTCERCGLTVAIDDSDPLPIRHACRVGPSPVRKALNFSKAAIGHLLAGSPTCSQEQIDARLAICRACPFFTGSACSHIECGCNVNAARTYLNKLAWADQACPDGKWGALKLAGEKSDDRSDDKGDAG
jgi:hypothetical protein